MDEQRRDEPRDDPRDPEEQRLPGDDQPTEPVEAPVDERSYAASAAESGEEPPGEVQERPLLRLIP